MGYWHRDENGKWRFDHSHLLVFYVLGAVVMIRLLLDWMK